MKRKHQILTVIVLLFSITVSVLFSSHVIAAEPPSLFHNGERWYRDSTAGLEVIAGIYYVPVDIFSMFDNIELSINSKNSEFMVYNRDTEAYISVLYTEKIATVNGQAEMYLNLYKLHGGYYYVPAEYFCSILSLQFESLPSGSRAGYSVQISDGISASLAELLMGYDSTPDSDTTDTDSTDSDTTIDTQPGVDTAHRRIYLTFNSVSESSVPQILRVLKENQLKAIFFFTEAELVNYPHLAVTVAASGHTIGLRSGNRLPCDEFIVEIDRANEYLSALLKIQTHIVEIPDNQGDFVYSAAERESIRNAGYIICNYTYDVPDSVGYSIYYVETLCEEAILLQYDNILRFGCNDTTSRVLPILITFLQKGPNYIIPSIHVCSDILYPSSTNR